MKKNKSKKMTVKEAMSLALFCKFQVPAAMDEISIQGAIEELRKATNRHPDSETLKVAFEVLCDKYARQQCRETNEPIRSTPADPEIPTGQGVVASWRDTRVWN